MASHGSLQTIACRTASSGTAAPVWKVGKMNDEPARSDDTASSWNEERVAVRLQEAIATWEHHYALQPVQRDFVAHAENVSAWIAMTSAHSLVEQALKAALKKRGRAEAKLRGVAGHNLGTLYDALSREDKRTVERELLDFAHRHGGMPWEGAAGFLSDVARDYEGWRYLLIELPPHDLSTTHPEVLLAVAKGLVRCLTTAADAPRKENTEFQEPDNWSERTVRAQGDGTKRAEVTQKRQWQAEKLRVFGLDKASERLKLHLGDNHRLADWIDPDQHRSASAWITISCGYSLLEQAFKALLYRRGDPQVERAGPVGHHVDKLYQRLPDADRATIEQGFAAYASLFNEIADSSAARFLRRTGRDYNKWRYLLVEQPKQLSAIHPAALLEIASLVIEILANETFTDHGMHHVGRRLHDWILWSGVNKALQEWTLERHEEGLTTPEAVALINGWKHEAPNLLTGFAAYLGGKIPDSEHVAEVLRRAELRLNLAAARPAGLDLRRFMERARDQANPLTWDSTKCLFVTNR